MAKPVTYEHAAGGPSNPTPATDGRRVVFLFDDYGVIVTDLEGVLQWEKRLPFTENGYSYGASPILDEGRIYLNRVGGLPIFICPSPVADGDLVVFGGWTTAHVGGRSRLESVFDEESGISPEAMRDPAAFFKQFDTNGDGRLVVDEFPKSRARDAFNFIDKNLDGGADMAEWAPAYSDQGVTPGRDHRLRRARNRVPDRHGRFVGGPPSSGPG